MKPIVVVEDEPLVRDLVALNLRHAGYSVETAATHASGIERLQRGGAALAILDMMLPDGDGVSLAKSARQAGFASPILMLTARNEPKLKVDSFNAGVDDYLTKPFSVPELLARVRALLRRETRGTKERLGVLLVNVGTPASTRTADVRRYLRQFLSDPRVIDIAAPLRWLLVNAVIVPFRAPKSAHAYKKIWREASPLMLHSQAQASALQELLPDHVVRFAMRYGEPSVAHAIDELLSADVDRLVVVPLYPQYSSAATGSAIAAVTDVLAKRPVVPAFGAVQAFYQHDGFVSSYASVIAERVASFSPDHVLFSYHGLPIRQVTACARADSSCQKSDACCDAIAAHNRHCYRAQCFETTRLLVQAAKVQAHSTSFQSRLHDQWIRPFSDRHIHELTKSGVRRLLVVCPSFVSDCLETLEEIGIRLRDDFTRSGGEALELVPCLNATPSWVKTLAELATGERHA